MSLDPAAVLGATAEYMPLVHAALHVAVVRAPDVLVDGLAALLEGRDSPATVEIGRALQWLAAKCAEPHGLPCAYQDAESGELHRIPATAVWRAWRACDGVCAEIGQAFAPFRAAAESLGVADCDVKLQIVVPRSELDARLDPEMTMLHPWLEANADEVQRTTQRLAEIHPDKIADWAKSAAEHGLPRLVATYRATRGDLDPGPPPNRKRVFTKHAVTAHEANFRRRWAEGEFDTPAAARRRLELELNARADGTCAKPGDPDHHRRPTIDRMTRGWFTRRP